MNSGLSREQVDALLVLLSSDDEYRDLFQKNLAAALAKLPGAPAVPPGTAAGACLMPAQLASKQQLAASRERLVNDHLAFNTQIPKILEP